MLSIDIVLSHDCTCSINMTGKSKKFLENSSIHGLRYIQSEYPLFHRILWLAIVIASFFGAWFLASAIWLRFMASPTRLSVISTYTPVNTIPFPAVTICPLNKMKITNIDNFIKTLINRPDNVTAVDIKYRLIPQMGTLSVNTIKYNMEDLKIMQEILNANRYNAEDVERLIAQSCKELLVRCLWEGEFVPCNDFFKFSHTQCGSCCSFNYKSHRREQFEAKFTEYFGPYLGLSIVFDVMNSDAMPFLRNDAALMIIHGNVDYPKSHSNIVFADKGHETFIGVEPLREFSSDDLSSLPSDSRDCILPHEIDLKYFRDYGEPNCQIECIMNITMKYCGCIQLFYPKRANERTCTLLDVPCTQTIDARMLNETEYVGVCECTYLCNGNYYHITTNRIRLDQNAITHSINKLYTGLNHNNTYGIVHVYFSKQTSTLARQDVLTSRTNLISNLGGVFGLFLGFSFVSLAEFAFYIYVKIKSMLGFGKTKKVKQVQQSQKPKFLQPNFEYCN